jgi:Tol biopolymer transport system component
LSTGTGNEELFLSTPIDKFPDAWSSDGRTMVFDAFDPKTKADLWILTVDGDRKPAPYRQTAFNEGHGTISPDGRWLAYTADDTGRAEIYIESFPVPGRGHYQISLDGGDEPMWRGDGKELYYRTADRKLMAVPLSLGEGLQAGTPQLLFETRAPAPGITNERNYYVVSKDGQKFLVFTLVEGAASLPMVTVLNWTAGLSH